MDHRSAVSSLRHILGPIGRCCMTLPAMLRRCLLAWLVLAAMGLWGGPAAAAGPTLLAPASGSVDAWPLMRLLSDPDGLLQPADALARLDDFQAPTGPHANLGPRRDVVWLALPVQAAAAGRWVLHVDYAPLQRVDLWLLRGGRVVQQQALGNEVPASQRPLGGRVPAVELDLEPGATALVLLRVRTASAMVLPVRLSSHDAFLRAESVESLLQGILAGVGLALVAYSLAHWVSLRDAMFLEYAMLTVGVTTFFIAYFGIGQQHLWDVQTPLLAKAAPLGILVALAGGSLFVASALRTRAEAPLAWRGLLTVSAVATAGFLLSVAGALDYRQTQVLATFIGPLPMLIAVSTAWRQARVGNRTSVYMLFGWTVYTCGALVMASLLRGLLPVNGWTQHAFQLACLTEMLVWLRVLGLHVETIRRDAERGELERQALVSLAHTDALTGLPNRRGLQQALAAALPACHGRSALAVFLLDLDGFKPVNDRLGHDAGDDLLVQVGQRLRTQVRGGDVVARLGGDEFVIMAPGIPGEAEALVLGRKLLDAFGQPFEVSGQTCRVGLTIGFALAPHDGMRADDLLKRADAAMYAGKQAGRHTVRRGGASPGLTFSS